MNRNALIIFVRNPELGKVKTRLAKTVGDEQALVVYKELLQHTHDISYTIKCDKFLYYVDAVNENDIWENDLFNKELQKGNDLGDRMRHAFFELFQLGYSKVIIIGSDCPELTALVIEDAFVKLETTDIVIGPSSDGGYYLLGLTQFVPELFNNKQWSTCSVLADTIRDVVNLNKSCTFLTELSDIDTANDLRRYKQMLKA